MPKDNLSIKQVGSLKENNSSARPKDGGYIISVKDPYKITNPSRKSFSTLSILKYPSPVKIGDNFSFYLDTLKEIV